MLEEDVGPKGFPGLARLRHPGRDEHSPVVVERGRVLLDLCAEGGQEILHQHAAESRGTADGNLQRRQAISLNVESFSVQFLR